MKRSFAIVCLSGWMLLAVASAQAGHGHHGHHGHGGWHVDFLFGGAYYPTPWYPPYYYYPAPAPVVYAPQQIYVPLSQTAVPVAPTATAAASAPASTPITIRSNTTPAYRGNGVTIRNPSASSTNVAFVVDSRTEVELKPGDEVPLSQKGSYFVEFDRGGDFGTSKQTLTEGSYEFVVTAKGWELQKTSSDENSPVPTPVVRRNMLPTIR